MFTNGVELLAKKRVKSVLKGKNIYLYICIMEHIHLMPTIFNLYFIFISPTIKYASWYFLKSTRKKNLLAFQIACNKALLLVLIWKQQNLNSFHNSPDEVLSKQVKNEWIGGRNWILLVPVGSSFCGRYCSR